MSPIIQAFLEKGDITFLGLRDAAVSLLPKDRTVLDKLYYDLERGKGILDDDDHLNKYLHSFGKMHKAKLDYAFEAFPENPSIFSDPIEIYDWGCGQGIATICLLDYLRSHRIPAHIKQITLVEPSKQALRRACEVLDCYDIDAPVVTIAKLFDDLVVQDFTTSNTRKLHLFSNILDVEGFDLVSFTHLFQHLFPGDNFFVCVGPYYTNNKRVDDFIAAVAPDTMFGTCTLDRGEWKGDWTISMRLFVKYFDKIELVKDIRKRIDDSHKEDQFFAGYILDAVDEELHGMEYQENADSLFRLLSTFDVQSSVPLGGHDDADPKLAVLANLVSRGLPTRAPLLLEETFFEHFSISHKMETDFGIAFPSSHRLSSYPIFEALHVIDPRFTLDDYNDKRLESTFEKDFIHRYLRNESVEYLAQVFEPQRPLSTVVSVPSKVFVKDQRVDFAFELPYGQPHTGYIAELDGKRYHSNIFQRINDERRDALTSRAGYGTYRVDSFNTMDFMEEWLQSPLSSSYLSILEGNYGKTLSGEWLETLQAVLTPLAVARVERMLIEAMQSGILSLSADRWRLAIVERDVPCAALAIRDFCERYENLIALAGSDERLPVIELSVVSTEAFRSSPLHLGHPVLSELPEDSFDLCMDISMLLRDNIDALPLHVNAENIYIIRSPHYKKHERIFCFAENISYPPFVVKDSKGEYTSIGDREELLTYFLQDIFRKPRFLTGQLPIISHILSDTTTVGLLPTGGGKSLTYQLSCLLQPGVSIVVDPLVSLMVDQVNSFHKQRIDACSNIYRGIDVQERIHRLKQLQSGSLLFMLLSPERFIMKEFRLALQTMTEKNHIYFSYGIIDEVHCVSEWGHDFRASYLQLGHSMITYMKTKSGRPLSLIGLTATASYDVLADVERDLTLGSSLSMDSETIVRPAYDTRPEITYRIIEVRPDYDTLRDVYNPLLLQRMNSDWDLRTVNAISKREMLTTLLKEAPDDISSLNTLEKEEENDNRCAHIPGYLSHHFYDTDEEGYYPYAFIVFCPHTKGLHGVKGTDTQPGIEDVVLKFSPPFHEPYCLEVGTFVGGDKPSGDMQQFIENKLNGMVSTKAFGMGVDKPNVRFTIHINHPSSIESYVQEAGRAGRDKMHAICYVLYDPTEYLYLSSDKLTSIKRWMGNSNYPAWLDRLSGRHILADDLPALCSSYGCSRSQTSLFMDVVRYHGLLENVDKNINMWFHNNTFRGLEKEQIILTELTKNILNVKPLVRDEVIQKLREKMNNDDIFIEVDTVKDALRIYTLNTEGRKRYGYLTLGNLKSYFNYVDYPETLCRPVLRALIDILQTYPNYSASYLMQPQSGLTNTSQGIYQALEHVDDEGHATLVITWENDIQSDVTKFNRDMEREVNRIALTNGWPPPTLLSAIQAKRISPPSSRPSPPRLETPSGKLTSMMTRPMKD